MKKFLCFSLCASLALLPVQADKPGQTPRPKWVLPVVCGLVVLGVGVVVVYEIHKTCKTFLDPQPANVNTNTPPNRADFVTSNGVPIQFVLNGKGTALNDEFVPCWDASGYGWTDPVSGQPITKAEQFKLECSSDFRQWTEAYTILSYTSDGGTLMLYSKGGLAVLTNYVILGQTNYVPLSLGSLSEPKKFFRIKPL